MKMLMLAGVSFLGVAVMATAQSQGSGSGSPTNLTKATTTVNNLPDGAVKADTQKKPDPTGQKASEYKPQQKPIKVKEPPLQVPPKK